MKKIYLVLAIITLSFFSCKNTVPDCNCLGERICPPSDFKVKTFEVGKSTIDLSDSISKVTVNAKFNYEASWSLMIIGKKTGATKSFSGKSDTISVTWFGNPDTETFFDAEECDVKLSISCIPDVFTKNFTITKKPTFRGFGFLVADFEKNGMVRSDVLEFGEYKFNIYYDDVLYEPKRSISDTAANLGSSPQGGKYFYLAETGAPGSFYICGSNTITSFKKTSIATKLTDPTQVYVNFFYNTNGNAMTNITSWIKGKGGNVFKVNLKNNKRGWNYASFKLSDYKYSGSSLETVTEMSTMGFDLESLEKGPKSVEFAIDFVIFTKGEPFIYKPEATSSSTGTANPFNLNSNNQK